MTAIKFLEPKKEEPKETLPATRPEFNLEEAKKSFAGYLETVDMMLATAKDLVVNNDKTNADATSSGTSAMALYKKIIAQKEATKLYTEAKDFVARFEAFITMITEKLYSTNKKKETIVSLTKEKIAQYRAVLESDRRKQQLLADQATEGLQTKLDEEAQKTGTVAPKVEPQIIPKKESVVRTESGASYTKKKWTFKVNDPEWHIKLIMLLNEIIPKLKLENEGMPKRLRDFADELKELAPFLILNETKVRRAVIDGRRHIGSLGDEGTAIHIYEEIETSYRTT
jgi:hypothetical protein